LRIVHDGNLDDIAALSDLLGRTGDGRAEGAERARGLFANVEHRQVEIGSSDVCRHRSSHGADSDKSDSEIHK